MVNQNSDIHNTTTLSIANHWKCLEIKYAVTRILLSCPTSPIPHDGLLQLISVQFGKASQLFSRLIKHITNGHVSLLVALLIAHFPLAKK